MNQPLLSLVSLSCSSFLPWAWAALGRTWVLSWSSERSLFFFLPISLHSWHKHLFENFSKLFGVSNAWEGTHCVLYHIYRLIFGVGIFVRWLLAKRLWIRWNFIVCAGIPGDSTWLAHLSQLFHLADIEQRLAGPDRWHRWALPLHTVWLEAMLELLYAVLLSSRWGSFSDQGAEVVCAKGRGAICFPLELHFFLRLLIATRSVWQSQVCCSGCCTRLVLQGCDRNDAISLSVLGCRGNKRFTGLERTDDFLGWRSFVFLLIFYQTGKLFVAFRWTLLVCWYSTRVIGNLWLA